MRSAFKKLSVVILTLILLVSAVAALCVAASADPAPEGAGPWTVSLTSRTAASASTVCRLSGGGSYADGESVTVIAYPRNGYNFVGWFDAADTSFANSLCGSQTYTFTVSSDTSLVALFRPATSALFHLTVHGSLYVVNNGAVQSDMYTASYNAGETMYLSFCDDTKEDRKSVV